MLPTSVEIVEVAPRDGLQNEAVHLATADKLALIDHAIAVGARRIEVTSFVNPKRVPQLADADAVAAGFPDRDDVTFIGLVLNARGAERAIATGRIDELGAVAVASDVFAMRNQGQTSDESVAAAREIALLAAGAGRAAQATIAVAFGCPFTGETPLARVIDMAKALTDDGRMREIGLADTIGVAVPGQVAEAVARVREAIAPLPVRVHFHNTRGTGIANVRAAIDAGATTVDASLGGLGGCPFAPGSAGNVATEDVLYLLAREGGATGLDLARAVEAVAWLGATIGRALPGMTSRAPAWPPAGER